MSVRRPRFAVTAVVGLLAAGLLAASSAAAPPLKRQPPQLVLPDLTSQRGITIGGVPIAWGGHAQLQVPPHAARNQAGKIFFVYSYPVVNLGKGAATEIFSNRIFIGATQFSGWGVRPMASGETRLVEGNGYLPCGMSVLSLRIDADGVIRESNERNNAFTVAVDVVCPKPPVPSLPGH